PDISNSLSVRLEAIIVAAPSELQEFLRSSADRLLRDGISIPSSLYTWLGGMATGIASALPAAMLFIVALTLSMYMISSDYLRVAGFLVKQLPPKWRQRVLESKNHMTATLGKWLKAQCSLAGVTSTQALAGLLILRVDYALIITIVIAIVDLLPVVGSGTVLIPWGAVCLLIGDVRRGAGLMVLWAVITVVRGVMEPRLVGRHIGLHPLASLICMYAGFKLMGVAGMLLFPMLAVLLAQLQEWEYVKLWKRE
ncbi:MAG: AI-2E family transporter, partial [Oscillospiraceae bacterium]|nr:AI-2E family transporter [Oscillospiraceae bacterium]